ncbi:MAG: Y-family DNA polymerase [Candidatus Electrothrix sp. AR4]|nr:Y-family DNA polymerase [Candidatus Electrothrix sp. AR4]
MIEKRNYFALVDCNNFYVSCERVFQPCLRNRPVVVLSNNDGCIIARSNEVKRLGISMGEPYFKRKPFLQRHGVQVFSCNFGLYGDLSHRVMSVLQEEEPEVEIYSIDEAFIRLSGMDNQQAADRCRLLRRRVDQCVGVPVSVGIGTTRTLAKLAASIAKKNPGCGGVCNFALSPSLDDILSAIAVQDIWGIGRRYTETLNRHRIYTALDLKNSDSGRIRGLLGLPGQRTLMELQGTPCISINESGANRKSVVSSRTFRCPVTTLDELKQAVSSFVSIAACKVRDQGMTAANVHVFLSTGYVTDKRQPSFSGSRTIPLMQESSATPTLIKAAFKAVSALYRQGYGYKKAGVMLTGLSSSGIRQHSLFFRSEEEQVNPLMEAVDRINDKWGRDTLRYGCTGLRRAWSSKRLMKSPAYTTDWGELPVAKA